MAADLKIGIIADYQPSLTGLNKVTESVDTLRKQLIKGADVSDKYYNAISRELQQLGKQGNTLASVKKQYELLAKQMEYVRLGLGTESGAYKTLEATAERYSKRLEILKAQKEADLELSHRRIQVAEELNSSQRMTLSLLEQAARTQGELNSKNANLGFMMLDGDRIGVATHAMREYEAILKQVIADNGLNSELTHKAYAEYVSARDYVARLNEETQRKIELEKADADELARVEKMTHDVMAQMEADRLERFALSIDQINEGLRQMEEQERNLQQTNANNAELGFMAVTGDEVGMATYTLRRYEQGLKNVIASTGINSQQTRVAAERYREQREYVDELNESMRANNTTTEQATKTTGGYLTRLVSLAKNILIFQLILGPIRKAVSSVSETIKDSVKVAAEAEQTFSKLSTVFEGVEASASSMARALSSEIGVASSTAASALSTIGDLLQAQGMAVVESLQTASEWAEQFQDIIAFKDINMSLEEFAQNFMSGAAGNLRNFRTFGSIVKESAVQAELAAKGLDKLTGEQLELQKMVIRANMALNQQANAMGATEREWNTTLSINRRWNEELKTTKELLGENINDALDKIKSKATEVLSRFNRMQKLLKSMEAGDIATEEWSNTPQNRQAIADAADKDFSATMSKAVSASIAAGIAAAIGSIGVALPEGLTTALGAGLVGVSTWLGGKAAQHASSAVPTVEELLALADATGASVSQIAEVLKEESKVANSVVAKWAKLDDTLSKNLVEANRQYKDKKAKEAARVNNFSSLQTASAGYDSFIEGLLGITGVDFIPSSFSGEDFDVRSRSDTGTNFILSKIQEATLDSVNSALESMDLVKTSKQLADVYGDVISGALDELDEGQLRESQIEAYRTLFETAWNEYGRDGKFTEEELASLENIKTSYRNAIDALNDYNAALELSAKILENIASLQANAASAQGTLADYLLQKDLNAKYGSELGANEFNRQKAAAEALSGYGTTLGNIRSSLGTSLTDSQWNYIVSSFEKGAFSGNAGIRMNGEEVIDATQAKQIKDAYVAYKEWMSAITEYYDYMADDIEKAEKSALIASRLEGAQSWASFKAGIHETQYTGVYAEADEWNDEMKASLGKTLSSLFDQGYTPKELQSLRAEGLDLIKKEYEAKKKEIDASNEAAEALKKIEAWAAVGNRALGSTGTMGGVIQSFQGEGDIWTKMVNAVLTILENTEAWGEIAEILNQMFEMFEPVVESMLDLIVSLSPVWDVIVFCLKIIASAIVIIQGAIMNLFEGLKALWENLKVAFHNLGEVIAHPLNAGKRDMWGWYTAPDVNAQTEKYLKEIWESVGSIERDTGAIAAGDLSVLEDLYSRNIINEAQYNAGARVLQKDMVFDPVRARDTQYITGGATPTSTISYGGITLQFYGTDLEEAKRMFLNILDGSGLSYDVAIGER